MRDHRGDEFFFQSDIDGFWKEDHYKSEAETNIYCAINVINNLIKSSAKITNIEVDGLSLVFVIDDWQYLSVVFSKEIPVWCIEEINSKINSGDYVDFVEIEPEEHTNTLVISTISDVFYLPDVVL